MDTLRTYQRGRWTVTLGTEYDEHPDLSWLGTYDDRPEDEWAIDLGQRPGRFRWFNPAWPDDAEHAQEKLERMEAYGRGDWYSMGIIATVSHEGTELGHASVWGIESDSDPAYIMETARDVAREAISQARATVGSLQAVLSHTGT